ncbi:membrane protein insertase YidC [filamentous cyanobacterium LEGE 11480]|uniref:Membrane protein insertase YidC n=1 Tax=Romeriopsis navalis LEGE 11480 TaxID=2777977 RepID=A0A928Z1Y8_9CYAN|nr:membrane protein insertase YidC [Romeriopsis navalis]MBE9028984.1 membrane protein insertase YidC [Romeriopsis navalis LEGE 11480]
MDFGIGFLSNNVMLPILDTFHSVFPSYGLAIVALTLVIRIALYPVNAGALRNMRKTRATQPIMQKRMKQLQERYKNDPAKQQAEMSALYKEFGNPLAGCLPLVIQMPVLFALFATLRGSPFTNVPYSFNLDILPQEKLEQVVPQTFTTKPQNIYVADEVHAKIEGILPSGNKVGVGERLKVDFQTPDGKSFADLQAQYPDSNLQPRYKITSGAERVKLNEDGSIDTLQPGSAVVQVQIPGLAADKGFLFIDALGQSGPFEDNLWLTNPDGTETFNFKAIHFDIVAMILAYGASLYFSQKISGQGMGNANPQQEMITKFTPLMVAGIFFFAPLPAGVLLYMIIANLFQLGQSFMINREPLPEGVQKIVADAAIDVKATAASTDELPFERKKKKKDVPAANQQKKKKKKNA